MRGLAKDIVFASRETLQGKRLLAFAIISFAIFSLFVLLPVWTTPGNDVAFQLHLFVPSTYALMIGLSLLNALLIMQQYHLRAHGHAVKAHHATVGSGIFVTSILSTLACASCYSSILAVFGLGGSIFVVQHRWWFAGIALALTLVAIAYTSRRIVHGCKACEIQPSL